MKKIYILLSILTFSFSNNINNKNILKIIQIHPKHRYHIENFNIDEKNKSITVKYKIKYFKKEYSELLYLYLKYFKSEYIKNKIEKELNNKYKVKLIFQKGNETFIK